MHAQQSGETQHEPVIPIDTMNYANGATTHALQLQKEAEELVRAAELEGAKKMAPKGLFKSLSPDYVSDRPAKPISAILRPGTSTAVKTPGKMAVLTPRNLTPEARAISLRNTNVHEFKPGTPKAEKVDPSREAAMERITHQSLSRTE